MIDYGSTIQKIPRRDPRKEDAVAKFYPQLVTLGGQCRPGRRGVRDEGEKVHSPWEISKV